MATIKRFEDLISWRKAREFVRVIYSLTKNKGFSKDFSLKDQIQRSAVSTMVNQAEGFTRGTKIELINYFFIEVQKLIQSFIDKVKKGSLSGIQHKVVVKKSKIEEFLEKHGFKISKD